MSLGQPSVSPTHHHLAEAEALARYSGCWICSGPALACLSEVCVPSTPKLSSVRGERITEKLYF